MKKNHRLLSSIFMLLLILGNFFVGISLPIVNALTTGEVYNYSEEIKSKVDSVKNKINLSELDPLYLTNNAYKESVINIKNQLDILDDSYNSNLSILDSGILLSSLITNSFPSKELEYTSNMPNDTTTIDVNNISDIKYIKSVSGTPTEIVLLTKTEIENSLISYYLQTSYNSINSIDSNYNQLMTDNQTNYNAVITKINNYISIIDTQRTNIETYETDELLLQNVPNMLINNISIYSLIDEAKQDLEEEKIGITIDNLTTKNDTIDTINDNIIDTINEFWLQNNDYIQLGLDLDISNLENEYIASNTCLTNWFSDINDYKNDNYSNYSNSLDTTLIDCYNNIISLETDYNTLISDINTYLARKQSDETIINTLKTNIETYREYLNSTKVLDHIDNLVELLKSEDEDTIDLLMNFLSNSELSDETKDKIIAAKLAFYPLSLKNTATYDLQVRSDYILLNGILGQLEILDLNNNIDYGFNYNINESSSYVTNTTELILKDRDNNLLKTYNIIIKGDIDNNGKVDSDDIIAFNNNLLTITNSTEEQLDRYDINDDGLINISDLVLLEKNILNLSATGTTTKSNFIVDRVEQNNLIYYNIYLETDGNVKGFQFDIDFSEDLIFNSYTTVKNGINIDNINNPKKVVGFEDYQDGDLLITIIFNNNENVNFNQTIFNILNATSIFDNYNINKLNNITNIFAKPIIEEIKEETQIERIVNAEETINDTVTEELFETTAKEIEEEEPVTEKEMVLANVIKIIIILVLGTVIIYLLNKSDEEQELREKNNMKSNCK